MTVMGPIGAPMPPALLFPAPGMFPVDARAELRARAADRAVCRRVGALRAVLATNRPDSAAHRAGLALFTETPADVTLVLAVWVARANQRSQP